MSPQGWYGRDAMPSRRLRDDWNGHLLPSSYDLPNPTARQTLRLLPSHSALRGALSFPPRIYEDAEAGEAADLAQGPPT